MTTLVDMSVDPQNSLQQLLGDMLRDEAAFNEFISAQENSLIPLATIVQFFALTVAALLALAYGIKIYRQRVPYLAQPGQRYRLSYRATLDTLSALGLRRRYGESREAFARRISDMTPSFTNMTNSHLMAALGSDNATAKIVTIDIAKQPDWLLLERQVRKEVSQHIPWWKRVIAFINPISWMKTH